LKASLSLKAKFIERLPSSAIFAMDSHRRPCGVEVEEATAGVPTRSWKLLVASVSAAVMMVVGGVSMHHYGNAVSSTTTAFALEQASSAARVSAADKFNEWWSKLHKVQGNIIKLKNEANQKADQEVHTISVSLPNPSPSSAPVPSPLRWQKLSPPHRKAASNAPSTRRK
jgi:hypothetical protein